MSEKKSFFKGLTILTIVFVVGILVAQYLPLFPVHPYIWWILIYNVLLTAGSYLLVHGGIQGDGFDFHNRFMGNTTIRLLLTATILFLYFYKVKVESINFVMTFFVFYFAFTLFEIKYLLANLRQNPESVDKEHEK